MRPFHVSAWIEEFPGSKPTIKQKLAAVRMLYDFLVVRQIVSSNLAHAVRGPKYVVKKGKTPVWSREDAKTLLDSIPKDSVSGLRAAPIAAMIQLARGQRGAEGVGFILRLIGTIQNKWLVFFNLNASFYLLDGVRIRMFIKIFIFVI